MDGDKEEGKVEEEVVDRVAEVKAVVVEGVKVKDWVGDKEEVAEEKVEIPGVKVVKAGEEDKVVDKTGNQV